MTNAGMTTARDNPFATARLERLLPFVPAWSGLSWHAIDARLRHFGCRCAITGNHGSGKTALLDALAGRWRARGCQVVPLFFNDAFPPRCTQLLALRRSITPATIVLCDGSEQLNFLQWRVLWHVASRGHGLLVTAHHRARLPVAVHLEATPELLARLLREVDPAANWDGHAGALLHAHEGNIREVFRACYLATAHGLQKPGGAAA